MTEGAPLTLSGGAAAGIAILIVLAVQAIRWILGWKRITWSWTYDTPSWVWVAIALVLSVGWCVWKKADLTTELNGGAPIDFVTGIAAYVVTGILIAVSSNVMYAVTKAGNKKLKASNAKANAQIAEAQVRIEQAQGTCAPVVDSNTSTQDTTAGDSIPVVSDPPVVQDAQQPPDAPPPQASILVPFKAQFSYDLQGDPEYLVVEAPNGERRALKLTERAKNTLLGML
jgi:hypothetical protein